jgi:superfamily II DNA or RNA helicase
MEHLLSIGTTTLGAPPGAGKTLMSAWLASQLGGLVLVLSPLTLVQRGWIATFEQYTDAKIWHNDGKSSIPSNCNVVLSMNTMFQKIPSEILSMVQTLIIDEAHMFCTPDRIHCLLGTTPKYIIACTATPHRSDEMQTIMHAVCGTHGIFIKPTKQYTVYKLLTGIEVEVEKTRSGYTNWPKLVKDLSDNADRNNIILNLVISNPTFKIMILTWSREHAHYLNRLFKENNISSDVLAGTKSSYKDSRVLVATFAKSGVGFDEAVVSTDWNGVRLNMMFLVGSTKNADSLCQFVGRIFRAEHPIIIDFVDNNSICKRHWNERKKWYEDPEQNGKVIEFKYTKEENVKNINAPLNQISDEEMNNEKVKAINSASVARAKLRIVNQKY